MATIIHIERKSGARFKAIIKSRGRILKTKTFKSKAKAIKWSKRIESDQEMMEALSMRGAAISFRSLAEEQLVQWCGRDRSWPGKVNWWIDRLGDYKLTNIDADLICDHLDQYAGDQGMRYDGMSNTVEPKWKSLGRMHKPASVNRMRSAISSVMKFAIQRRYIRKNPVMDVPTRPENNRITRWLNDDERKRLLQAAQNSTWEKLYLLILLAITTGARRGELLSLRWENFDFKNRTYLLHQTKNGEPRVLTFPPNAIKELMKFRQATGLVFASQRKQHRPMEFNKHWRKALCDANIEKFRFHDLRHTAASYLVMNGATLQETAHVLGHKSTVTTERYAHLSLKHKQALTDRVFGIY